MTPTVRVGTSPGLEEITGIKESHFIYTNEEAAEGVQEEEEEHEERKK